MFWNIFVKGICYGVPARPYRRKAGIVIYLLEIIVSPMPVPNLSSLFPGKLSKDILVRVRLHGMFYVCGLQNAFMQL